MAVGANRGDFDQSAAVQGPAMYALFIFLEGLFSVDVVFDHYLHILVADGAGSRYVCTVNGRFRVLFRPDVMAAVAVTAGRGVWHAEPRRNPVNAVFILVHGRKIRRADVVSLDVASLHAANFLGVSLVVRSSDHMLDLSDIEMTVQALELFVNGTPESGDIDVGGLLGVAALGVTSLAVVPLYLLGPYRAGGGDKQYAKERGKKRLSMHFSLDSDGSGSVERLESAHSQRGFRESPATEYYALGLWDYLTTPNAK